MRNKLNEILEISNSSSLNIESLSTSDQIINETNLNDVYVETEELNEMLQVHQDYTTGCLKLQSLINVESEYIFSTAELTRVLDDLGYDDVVDVSNEGLDTIIEKISKTIEVIKKALKKLWSKIKTKIKQIMSVFVRNNDNTIAELKQLKKTIYDIDTIEPKKFTKEEKIEVYGKLGMILAIDSTEIYQRVIEYIKRLFDKPDLFVTSTKALKDYYDSFKKDLADNTSNIDVIKSRDILMNILDSSKNDGLSLIKFNEYKDHLADRSPARKNPKTLVLDISKSDMKLLTGINTKSVDFDFKKVTVPVLMDKMLKDIENTPLDKKDLLNILDAFISTHKKQIHKYDSITTATDDLLIAAGDILEKTNPNNDNVEYSKILEELILPMNKITRVLLRESVDMYLATSRQMGVIKAFLAKNIKQYQTKEEN